MTRVTASPHHATGFSLLELMISIVIAMVISAGALKVYSASSKTYYITNAITLAMDGANFVLDTLRKDISMAGYSKPNSPGVRGIYDQLTLEGGTDNDQVALRFSPVDGIDCTGNPLQPDKQSIVNVYYVEQQILFCRSYDPADQIWAQPAQALINGLDSFQVLYGEKKTVGTVTTTQYHTADSVTDWDNVMSVRVGVITNSLDAAPYRGKTQRYSLLNLQPVSFTDGKARAVFSTTVFMTNAEWNQ